MMQLQSNRRPLSLHLNEDVIRGNEENEEEEEAKEEVAKWDWAEMDERNSQELMNRVRHCNLKLGLDNDHEVWLSHLYLRWNARRTIILLFTKLLSSFSANIQVTSR